MTSKQQYGTGIIAAIGLMFLIFDSKAMVEGAREGIVLTLYTVIPALFPFILATSILNGVLIGKKIPGLQTIGRWCGIPLGAESVFLLGMMGGYPIGAKAIRDAHEAGQLDSNSARRLLGFCNNAGPAFIFGILSPMFNRPLIPFVVWAIHILSALLVGALLPDKSPATCQMSKTTKHDLSQTILHNIKTMAMISAWIMIWRIILSICSRLFLHKFPTVLRVVFMGLCEMTNGCLALEAIKNESVRLIVVSCLLAGGGLCIAMQTKSVTGKLGTGMYFQGKILQVLFSFVLSAAFSYVLYPAAVPQMLYLSIPAAAVVICCVILIIRKKENNSSFSANCVI